MTKLKFREKDPVRRTYKKVLKHHSSHRDRLKVDFNHKCGYCDSSEEIAMEDFQVDHFAPQKKFLKTKFEARLNEYTNLVYSCRSCNRSKLDKWPSEDFDVSRIGDVGFLCPCDPKYKDLFFRNVDGEIFPEGNFADYIYKELELQRIRYSLLWQLESVDNSIKQLQKNTPNDPKLTKLYADFYKLLTEFKKAKGLSDTEA